MSGIAQVFNRELFLEKRLIDSEKYNSKLEEEITHLKRKVFNITQMIYNTQEEIKILKSKNGSSEVCFIDPLKKDLQPCTVK